MAAVGGDGDFAGDECDKWFIPPSMYYVECDHFFVGKGPAASEVCVELLPEAHTQSAVAINLLIEQKSENQLNYIAQQ